MLVLPKLLQFYGWGFLSNVKFSYFARAGYVDLSIGSLGNAGFNGYYWSSTAATTESRVYHFVFNKVDTTPSFINLRLFGFTMGWNRVLGCY